MNIIIESMTQSHLDKIRDNLQENFDEFWNTPPDMAQAPVKITILGLGTDL